MKDLGGNGLFRKDSVAAQRVQDVLATLDVEPLLEVLCRQKPDGLGWNENRSSRAVEEYKRFLYLNAAYPDQRIVPNRIVDDVWHVHILDTRKYAADCDALFGYFLHHSPYFGQRGDAEVRDQAFDQTQEIYAHEFGEGLLRVISKPEPRGNSAEAFAGEIRAAGCDAGDVRLAGCDAGDIRAAGCDAGDVRPAGCDAGDIRTAGCDTGDIRSAGCDAGDIRAAGCDAGDVRPGPGSNAC